MKNTLLLITIIFLAISLHAENTFEGSMSVKQESPKGASQVNMLVKQNMLAVNPGGKGTPSIIIDLESGEMYSVVDQGGQKMIMKLNLKILGSDQGLAMISSSTFGFPLGDASNDASVTNTGESKTINGHKCTKYIIKDNETYSVIWATNDVGFSFSSLIALMNAEQKLGPLTNMMPIEGSVKDTKSGEVSNFSIVVDEKPVDASQFKIPDGYPVMDMTMLLKQSMQDASPEELKMLFQKMIPR